MKLTKVRIKNFKSIQGSIEFDIDDKITCLIGKNQAGKTTLLEALNQVDPIETRPNISHPASTDLTYILEDEDCQVIKERFGNECLKGESPTITLKKESNGGVRVSNLNVDTDAAVKHLVENTKLSKQYKAKLLGIKDPKSLLKDLEAQYNLLTQKEQIEDTQEEQINDLNRLRADLPSIISNELPNAIYHQILRPRTPRFLYIDKYYDIQGKVNLTELQSRINDGTLDNSDHSLRTLVDNATLQKILKHGTNDSMKLERHIIEKDIKDRANEPLDFWSKNKYQQIDQQQIDVEISHESSNWFINLMVRNTTNNTRIPLDYESHGFLWFFSFLLWYQQLFQENPNLILLLDEPALYLHGTAQEDILRCFEEYLAPKHQIIYTTHSPFMIDINNLNRTRIVENLSLKQNHEDSSTKEQGTKVTSDILQVEEKSILPIQSAVGFNINQIHGKGQNILIVEGESDILYLKTMSEILQKHENGLDPNWEYRSAGSISRIPNTIIQYQIQDKSIGKKFNIAVLTDYHPSDKGAREKIKEQLGREIITYKDFIGKEADVEDMFTPEFYLKLVNPIYGQLLDESNLNKHPRIVCRLEEYFKKNPLPNNEKFSHKKPAEYFKDNIDSLEHHLDDTTFDRFQWLFDTLNELLVPQTSNN